ncbi:MAG: T9SS type A sorting domain-containing protein [Bacteroidales bacterium]
MMRNYKIISIVCKLTLCLSLVAGPAESLIGSRLHADVLIVRLDDTTFLENGKVQARFAKNSRTVSQEFYAKKGGEWELVAKSFYPEHPFPANGNKLFNTALSQRRILANENFSGITSGTDSNGNGYVELSGSAGGVLIKQRISLVQDADYFHFDVSSVLPEKPAKLEYLLSTFVFNWDSVPEFVHTPTLKYNEIRWKTPAEEQIIGDRSFYSPTVILQQGGLFASLLPDLDMINDKKIVSPDARRTIMIPRNQFSVPIVAKNYTMPTALDLNVKTGLTKQPVFSFGLIDNIVQHHIRYLHPNDGSMVRTLDSAEPSYGFDLFIGADVPAYAGYQGITRYIWAKYGHPLFTGKRHLAMPFTEYVKTVQEVTFAPMAVQPGVEGYKNEGSFLSFDLNGQPAGGFRSAVPGWLDALWNCMFWNNVRDASGLWFWGQKLNDSTLTDKARRIINLTLAAPQNAFGLFPLIYRASAKTWQNNSFDVLNGQYGLFSSGQVCGTYDVVSMSMTCARLLEYYRNCEADSRILPFVKKYGDWLAGAVNANGTIPSYVGTNMKLSDVLLESAQPAAGMWFLAELNSATGDQKYLDAAEKIAAYLVREILPRQKWVDLEQYFSCGAKPLAFTGDEEQGQLARGNLSVGWAAKGFAALYRASGKQSYLEAGEKCIDYLTFTQCSWDPHYIYTAYPFGGFTVDNADHATYLDARQAEYAEPFIWYGKTLGRQDLLERGVAAARSSVVLINHPLHKSNGIYEYTNIYPFGLGPENIDHEGHPQSAMRTHAGWGEGSGVFTGLSDAYRELGGAYINTEKNLAVGVDGVTIKEYSLSGKTLTIAMASMLDILKEPWKKPYKIALRIDGLDPDGLYTLILNGERNDSLPGSKLSGLVISAYPGGDLFVDQARLDGKNDYDFSVYPNPSTDLVNIDATKGFDRLRYFSQAGRLISGEAFVQARKKLCNISNLPAGIYFLEVSDGENSAIKKLVKLK